MEIDRKHTRKANICSPLGNLSNHSCDSANMGCAILFCQALYLKKNLDEASSFISFSYSCSLTWIWKTIKLFLKT